MKTSIEKLRKKRLLFFEVLEEMFSEFSSQMEVKSNQNLAQIRYQIQKRCFAIRRRNLMSF